MHAARNGFLSRHFVTHNTIIRTARGGITIDTASRHFYVISSILLLLYALHYPYSRNRRLFNLPDYFFYQDSRADEFFSVVLFELTEIGFVPGADIEPHSVVLIEIHHGS